jgi:hypothetical protein
VDVEEGRCGLLRGECVLGKLGRDDDDDAAPRRPSCVCVSKIKKKKKSPPIDIAIDAVVVVKLSSRPTTLRQSARDCAHFPFSLYFFRRAARGRLRGERRAARVVSFMICRGG